MLIEVVGACLAVVWLGVRIAWFFLVLQLPADDFIVFHNLIMVLEYVSPFTISALFFLW